MFRTLKFISLFFKNWFIRESNEDKFRKIVSDKASDGHFHLLKGLGHCSLFRHKPKVVADKIREIISFNTK